MAVAAYGAARSVVSGSSDPGRVAGVLLIAGALGLLYLYEQGGLARLFARTKAAAGVGGDVGAGTGNMSTPQGSGQAQEPIARADAPPPLPPVTSQQYQQYQQNYAHPLTQPQITQPQTQQGGAGPYLSVPRWVWKLP